LVSSYPKKARTVTSHCNGYHSTAKRFTEHGQDAQRTSDHKEARIFIATKAATPRIASLCAMEATVLFDYEPCPHRAPSPNSP